MGLLTNDAAVIAEGVKYLQIICFTYLMFTVTNILTASLRSVGIVKIGYIISASTLILNMILNSCLIYGNFGFPELGIRGAAVATLCSRTVELLIVIWYLKYKEHSLNLTLKKLVFIDRSYIRDYKRTALPVLTSQAQWGLAQMAQTGVLGHLGAPAIAANSIATIVFQIITVVVYGSASASGIMIGWTIGEGLSLIHIYDKLPEELLLSWTPEELDYIHDITYWSNIISHCKKADLISIYEMESNSEVWSDWIKQNNEYAINDRKAIEAGGGDYLNFIAIILQKK